MTRPLLTRGVDAAVGTPTHLRPRARPSDDTRADAWAWLSEVAGLG